MRDRIIELCKKCGADLIGFAPISRFGEESPVRKLMPEAKTVIGLGFRVLRGAYRGIEEGSTYYQYTTMAVENMEETVYFARVWPFSSSSTGPKLQTCTGFFSLMASIL